MKKIKDIQLSESDLKTIFGKDYKNFQTKILTNCFCMNCAGKKGNTGNSTIVNYKIVLNNLNDITLLGSCKTCGSRINRYVETGEVEQYSKPIKIIRRKYDYDRKN